MIAAYYNEFDPQAAAWLRELISQGHIAPGEVDTRSIEDVRPDDLRGYTQCHFFAGIGVWSYALRQAGWPDDRPVWTGSCPCQPFSAAGKGAAFADERHLWPSFHHLIKECKPAIVLGEQVASKVVDDWIDLVHADLEAVGYTFGSVPFPSAGVGAPHIRDRNYWAAYTRHIHDAGQKPAASYGKSKADRPANKPGGRGVSPGGMADALREGPLPGALSGIHCGEEGSRAWNGELERPGAVGGLADDELQQRPGGKPGVGHADAAPGREQSAAAVAGLRGDLRPGPTNGFWRDADWLGCRDGKWRPVEPGTFPLVDGAAARVVRLRGYGNAINAKAAQAWIETVMETAA